MARHLHDETLQTSAYTILPAAECLPQYATKSYAEKRNGFRFNTCSMLTCASGAGQVLASGLGHDPCWQRHVPVRGSHGLRAGASAFYCYAGSDEPLTGWISAPKNSNLALSRPIKPDKGSSESA